MNSSRKFVTSALVLLLLLTEACNKKKPVLPVQAGVPTTVAEVLPDEIPENPETPIVEPAPPKTQQQQPAKTTKPKKPARTQTAKKTAPPTGTPAPTPTTPAPATAANNNQQVAALHPPHNGTPETAPDLAIAAVPTKEASQHKEDTAHMVDATENALKSINRSLSDEEKAMLTQIQSYLQQSRKATADGDYERAYNLAKKAQLLADALNKK
jgi:hypothetical protein